MDLIKQSQTTTISKIIGSFSAQVYGWMGVGLIVTAAISFSIYYLIDLNPAVGSILLLSLPLVLIFELILVIVLSSMWRKFNGLVSLGLFLLYSIFTGLFLGLIMYNYTIASIFFAFAGTAVVFFLLSIYGLVTKTDLTKWGSIAIFGLIGLVIATFINIILAFVNPTLSNGLYWILTYVGVIIFLILIAFDSQKLRMLAAEAEQRGDGIMKYSIQGALILYLDFINLFIRILAITGKRRN